MKKQVVEKKPSSFEYENGFMMTSGIDRMGKILAHYELYKKIASLPGAIVECGVFKGNSFIQFATFRNLIETPHSRRIIGFDTFGKVPPTEFKDDKKYLQRFISTAGTEALSTEALEHILDAKKITNTELVAGDVVKTVPQYLRDNPHLKIALLHIDTDIYEPAKTILETLYNRVVRGGIIAFDDYGTFPGETKAADDFFAKMNIKIEKFPLSHIPSFIIKP